jgi:hypothetical protein
MIVRCRRMGDHGSVPVEYMAVFGFVTIGLTIPLVRLGPALVDAWSKSETVLLANKP